MSEVDWNRVSRRYNEIVFKDPAYPATLQTMAVQLVDAYEASILDLGCGTGNLIQVLLDRYPDSTIYGIDPSSGMREVTAARYSDHPNVTIQAGGALALSFPAKSFDYVVSNLTLHHVFPDSRGECALEIARVLKTGGISFTRTISAVSRARPRTRRDAGT